MYILEQIHCFNVAWAVGALFTGGLDQLVMRVEILIITTDLGSRSTEHLQKKNAHSGWFRGYGILCLDKWRIVNTKIKQSLKEKLP